MIRPARFPEEADAIREVLREYQLLIGGAICFQEYDQELAALPGAYAPPGGTFLVAEDAGQITGTAALHSLGGSICEMKRLYVRPSGRGAGLGRTLTEAIITDARARGYSAMRLDTLPIMDRAIALYRALGFRDIAPYRANPYPGTLYLELTL